jgi:hypothetical protein
MPGVTNEGAFKDLLAVVDVGPPELKASAIQLFVRSDTTLDDLDLQEHARIPS